MPANLTVDLPWQSLASQASALQGLGGNPQQAMAGLGQAYSNSYLGALNLNAGIYQGGQTGYEALRGQLDKQYGDISKGYKDLYGDVLGRIAGTNQTNLNDIAANYSALSGSAAQQAVSRGIGNTTIQQNMQRGIAQDASRARTASENQFAQLGAGYASQLGQAGLQAQQQGAGLGAQLGLDQLRFQQSVQAPYPDAKMFTNLAQMYGQQAQGQQDRKQAQDAMSQLLGNGGFSRSGVSGVSGGSHGFGPMQGPSMYDQGGGSPYSTTDVYGGGGAYGGGVYNPSASSFNPDEFYNSMYGQGVGAGIPGEPDYAGTGEGNSTAGLYSGGPSTGNYDYNDFYG